MTLAVRHALTLWSRGNALPALQVDMTARFLVITVIRARTRAGERRRCDHGPITTCSESTSGRFDVSDDRRASVGSSCYRHHTPPSPSSGRRSTAGYDYPPAACRKHAGRRRHPHPSTRCSYIIVACRRPTSVFAGPQSFSRPRRLWQTQKLL